MRGNRNRQSAYHFENTDIVARNSLRLSVLSVSYAGTVDIYLIHPPLKIHPPLSVPNLKILLKNPPPPPRHAGNLSRKPRLPSLSLRPKFKDAPCLRSENVFRKKVAGKKKYVRGKETIN